MSSEVVQTHTDDRGVARVVLNKPDKHNAFDDAIVAELVAALGALDADDAIRVVVLAATGKSFSAGADLDWMRRSGGYSREENLADARRIAALMKTLARIRQPTVALVQGAAYGGGVGLVACCDIAIASERARFCLSEVKLGLIPAVISPYVTAALGQRAARRYALSAEVIPAPEARRLGLVHEVVAHDELEAAGARLVETLLANGPRAMRAAKRLVDAVRSRPIDDALIDDTAERIATQRAAEEGREGVSAFLEKREPGWRQKFS